MVETCLYCTYRNCCVLENEPHSLFTKRKVCSGDICTQIELEANSLVNRGRDKQCAWMMRTQGKLVMLVDGKCKEDTLFRRRKGRCGCMLASVCQTERETNSNNYSSVGIVTQ